MKFSTHLTLISWLLINRCFLHKRFRYMSLVPFWTWHCPTRPPWNSGKTTGLEVLIASPGTSGTTSMQTALTELGYNTYKIEDVHFFMPEILRSDLRATDFINPMRQCGVTAFAIEPWLEMLPAVLKASPGVKVVLSMSLSRNGELLRFERIAQVGCSTTLGRSLTTYYATGYRWGKCSVIGLASRILILFRRLHGRFVH